VRQPHRGVAVAIARSRPATGHRQGLYPRRPSLNREGLRLCGVPDIRRCRCRCAHRARPATGHRQGLYVEQPSPEMVGVLLWACPTTADAARLAPPPARRGRLGGGALPELADQELYPSPTLPCRQGREHRRPGRPRSKPSLA